jgi:hypothetical protein
MPIRGEGISESFCCGCCCSCGQARLYLDADVQFLEYDKIFHIRGSVDAAMSKTAIKDYKVALREHCKRVASSGATT